MCALITSRVFKQCLQLARYYTGKFMFGEGCLARAGIIHDATSSVSSHHSPKNWIHKLDSNPHTVGLVLSLTTFQKFINFEHSILV